MLNPLQACRALAAVLVVFFHASGTIFALAKYFDRKPFGLVFDFGHAGVDFFFVLSGFLMMHVHAKEFDPMRAGRPFRDATPPGDVAAQDRADRANQSLKR